MKVEADVEAARMAVRTPVLTLSPGRGSLTYARQNGGRQVTYAIGRSLRLAGEEVIAARR